MYSSYSLKVATLLLLAAVTTTAQPQGNPLLEQFQQNNPIQLPQFQQGDLLERLIQQWQEHVLQYEKEIQRQEALAVTPEQKQEVALYRQQFVEYKQKQEEQMRQYQQQLQQYQHQHQPQQQLQQQETDDFLVRGGSESVDILDAILANGTLSSLSDGNIARFLDNEASVNSLAGCFANEGTCFSAGAKRVVDELRALQPGTLCLDCQPGEEERLNEVIYQLVSGLSTRYPDQWGIIFPQIFSTIVAFQQKVAQQQQQQ